LTVMSRHEVLKLASMEKLCAAVRERVVHNGKPLEVVVFSTQEKEVLYKETYVGQKLVASAINRGEDSESVQDRWLAGR